MAREIMDPSNNDNVITYNRQILPPIKDVESTYSLVARAQSHNLFGGDTIEIHIYLSGLGVPNANKLSLLWSSKDIIDTSVKGDFAYSIRLFNKMLDGEHMIIPIAPKVIHQELDATGVWVRLNKAYFLPIPFLPVPEGEELDLPTVMGEIMPEGRPPVSISLKTINRARPGSYAIDVTFTYRYGNIVKQACDRVEFNISSWWDRNQGWILTTGAIITFILLILSVVNTFILVSGE